VGYADVSFWLETCGDDLSPRPALTRDHQVDTVVVGAGFTGLWTAHFLSQLDPGRRVAVVERDIAGFGASGRNGGWASAFFPIGPSVIARRFGKDAPRRVTDVLARSVGDLGDELSELSIDAHFHRGGELSLATSPAQLAGLSDEIEEAERYGLKDRYRLLDRDTAQARFSSPLVLGALFDPDCAVLNPARLVRGLARRLTERGVELFERTAVTGIENGAVTANGHRLTAGQVVLATEAYTSQLPGLHRTVLPVYSLIALTERLGDERWSQVGWRDREAVTDGRHILIYLQRTADGRVLFGGRGAPYHLGSKISADFDRHEPTFGHLHREFERLFPYWKGVRFTHHWGGPVAISRDWVPSIGVKETLAWSRGYAGDGVTFSFLAGRTLADLLVGSVGERTEMPWVNHQSRLWPIEPLRLIGSRIVYWSFRRQDVREEKTGRRRASLTLGGVLSGRNR